MQFPRASGGLLATQVGAERNVRYADSDGGVAERTKAAVLKTVRRASVSGVRIPPPPPAQRRSYDPVYDPAMARATVSTASTVVGCGRSLPVWCAATRTLDADGTTSI